MQSHLWSTVGTRQFGFRDDLFQQNFFNVWYEISPVGDFWMGVSSGVGKQVDFAFEDPNDSGAARQGDLFRLEPRIRYNLGRRLRADLSHQFRELTVDEGRVFTANLTQLNLAFQLNVRTFFRAILQYQDVNRDTDLYPECVTDPVDCGLEKNTRSLFTQLLFSYKVNPQTAVFVGYTENQQGGSDVLLGEDEIGLTPVNRTLFFKVGYAWVQ
jgi:hypothetical protein